MIKIKKALLFLLIIILAVFPSFADDATAEGSSAARVENTQWWVGMPISDFEYTGLVNVEERTVDGVLSQYIGETFTDELFARIYNTLYAQNWVEYISAEAIRGGSTGASLVIRFNIVENPMVSSVSVNGNDNASDRSLLDVQNYSVGSFISSNDYNANASLVRDYYLSRGYRDATVTCTSTFDAATNTEAIVYEVTEGEQYKIRSITFDGATVFTQKELANQIESHQRSFFNSGNFVQSTLDTDRTTLLNYYYQNGYTDAQITDVEIVDSTEEGDKTRFVNVIFHITEGAQYFFGTITFNGNTVYDNDYISSIINIQPGAVHDTVTLQNMYMDLYTIYQNNGYSACQIIPVPTVNEETHTVDYVIYITEGSQSYIEEIRIEGLTKTRPRVFERELTIHVGDIYNRDAIIRSQQNIYNTGLVRNIRVGMQPGETENGLILIFEIEEGNQMELQFGATFGGTLDEFPISGFLSWSDRNLFGTGRDLSISTTLSPSTQSLSLALNDDWVGNHRWSNGVSLSLERSHRTNVLQRGTGSDYYNGWDRYHQTYPLGFGSADEWYASDQDYPSTGNLMEYDYYRIAVGYNTGYTFAFDAGNLTIGGGLSIGVNHAAYDDSQYDPYEELIVKYHDGWRFSNRLSLSLTWDGRDLVQNTTRGYVISGSFTYAGGFLFGLSNYNRLSVSASAYHSLFHTTNDEGRESHLVLSGTSSVSFMLPQYWNDGDGWRWHEASEGATTYEMLYIDGMNIGRGFDPVTHLSFLWNNQIELSYPLVLDILNVEGFVSASAVTETLEELSAFGNIDWYFAGGVGIRLSIPGFPLGLYLVKNATLINNSFQWDNNGFIGGLKLVLAISTSIY